MELQAGGLGYVARADLSIAPGTPGYANGARQRERV